MTVFDTAEQLVEIEKECLGKFRSRAQKLRDADPKLSREISFAKAVQAMPKTANRYQFARSLLASRGIAGQPLGL